MPVPRRKRSYVPRPRHDDLDARWILKISGWTDYAQVTAGHEGKALASFTDSC